MMCVIEFESQCALHHTILVGPPLPFHILIIFCSPQSKQHMRIIYYYRIVFRFSPSSQTPTTTPRFFASASSLASSGSSSNRWRWDEAKLYSTLLHPEWMNLHLLNHCFPTPVSIDSLSCLCLAATPLIVQSCGWLIAGHNLQQIAIITNSLPFHPLSILSHAHPLKFA